ncbi:hypothetical protein L3Y34_007217 [Caenorhabditis briggsae]|uniref:Uncharacterized protein n=2 Tax=Caenorhabditis briggsae TaxID=6238 RepID=A0AAE9CYN9_CAEBR|nr:hypothetical protein L3Y34_007217 [Caenorhabditis briggsae]
MADQVTSENSTMSSMEICARDVSLIESFIFSGIVFYVFMFAMQKIVSFCINYRTDKKITIPYECTLFSKIIAFNEMTVCCFSVFFLIYYALKYNTYFPWIFYSWGPLLGLFAVTKLLTEMLTIAIALVAISVYLYHLTLHQSGWQWSDELICAVWRVISSFVFLKETVIAVWILVASLLMSHPWQVLEYYYGIHISVHILLLLSVIVRFMPGRKAWNELSNSEKMVNKQAFHLMCFQLPVLANVIYYSYGGVGHGTMMLSWIFMSIFLLPLSIRYLEMVEQIKTRLLDANEDATGCTEMGPL